jgi:cytochrome bd-type quinol oxidase subunit 2
VRVNRFLAVVLGLLSILPLAAVPLSLFVLFPQVANTAAAAGRSFLVEGVLIMAGFLVMAFYVAYVWRSRRVPRAQKRMWSMLIIIGSVFTMPVFWFLYIWKDRPVEQRPTLEQYVSGAA